MDQAYRHCNVLILTYAVPAYAMSVSQHKATIFLISSDHPFQLIHILLTHSHIHFQFTKIVLQTKFTKSAPGSTQFSTFIQKQREISSMSESTLDRQSLLTTELPPHQHEAPLEDPSAPKPSKIRIQSLDVYRGLTMVGMILVDNMGAKAPWFLEHAEWEGLTPADLIFPAFLFILGLAIPLAVSENRPVKLRNLLRIAGLFLIGFFLNLLGRKFDFEKVRVIGILQRLSICYAVGLLLHLATNYGDPMRRKLVAFFMFAVYCVYTALMVSFDGQDSLGPNCNRANNLSFPCNFAGYVDQLIFTSSHCFRTQCPDPEGLMSTLGAILTTYLGYEYSLLMKQYKSQPKKLIISWLSIAAVLGLAVYPVTLLMPLNKQLYSSSFTLIVVAISGASLTVTYVLVDVLPSVRPGAKRAVQTLTGPLKWLGLNPLAIFVGMDVLAIFMIIYIKFEGHSVWSLFYKHVFASWISNEEVASTVFACFFLLLWTAVAGLLHKHKLYLRL